MGRLTADPESRVTVEGIPMAKFRLVVNRPVAGGASGTDFIDVVAWRRLAEVCTQHLKKNALVLVEGRIQNRSFEDQTGQRRWVTEVVASNLTLLGKAAIPDAKTDDFQLESTGEETVEDADLASDLPF